MNVLTKLFLFFSWSAVSLLLDQGFKAQKCCYFHPLTNETTICKWGSFLLFLVIWLWSYLLKMLIPCLRGWFFLFITKKVHTAYQVWLDDFVQNLCNRQCWLSNTKINYPPKFLLVSTRWNIKGTSCLNNQTMYLTW